MTKAALGFRAHSGWATLVAVAGPLRSPTVIDRRRLELVDPGAPECKQPYHAAEDLPLARAATLVNRCTEAARRLARQGVSGAVDDIRRGGHELVGCGLILGSGRPLTSLASMLASHALIHTAEGELFRDVLARASAACDLAVRGIKEKELEAKAAAELGCPQDELRRRLGEMGRSLGPPWRQDEKLATLVAWLILSARLETTMRA